MGGPFDILYQPRATPRDSTAPKKTGPKPSQSYHARTLAALTEPKPVAFCLALPSQGDRDKTKRIAKTVI